MFIFLILPGVAFSQSVLETITPGDTSVLSYPTNKMALPFNLNISNPYGTVQILPSSSHEMIIETTFQSGKRASTAEVFFLSPTYSNDKKIMVSADSGLSPETRVSLVVFVPSNALGDLSIQTLMDPIYVHFAFGTYTDVGRVIQTSKMNCAFIFSGR